MSGRERSSCRCSVSRLTRPENPWAEMARSSAASDTSSQQNFRTKLSAFYGYSEQAKPKCIATEMEDNPSGDRVVAAHIWPRYAASAFPLDLEDGVNNASNGMFLHEKIEEEMDRLHVCFVCDPFKISAKFVVLHRNILDEKLSGTQLKYRDLHLKDVEFKDNKRPSFKLLSRHAQQAFGHTDNQQWMDENIVSELKSVVQVGSPQKPDA